MYSLAVVNTMNKGVFDNRNIVSYRKELNDIHKLLPWNSR